MNATSKASTQLDGILTAMVAHCPDKDGDALLSDLYFHANPKTGVLTISDDDENIIHTAVVSAWKDYAGDDFYSDVQRLLQEAIGRQRQLIDDINLLQPFSLVLIGDDHETLAELYIVDDDTMLLTGELMGGLEEDLDTFLKHLMEE